MPTYSLSDYDNACQESNAAYAVARMDGFTDVSLKVLGSFAHIERTIYESFSPNMKRQADQIRAKYVPEPLKAQYVGEPVPAMRQGNLPI